MQGTRMYGGQCSIWPPGAYGLVQGFWHIRDPKGELGNISGHQVTEHEDGTITVSPSILDIKPDGTGYHGYLVAGVWTEC